MDPVFNAVQQNLNSALSIPFVSSAVTLGLAFYAYKAAPELPSFVEELFLNVFFQIFVGFMVLYMTTGNFMLSLVVSAVFIYGMRMLSNLKEGMFGGGGGPYGNVDLQLQNKLENIRKKYNLSDKMVDALKKIITDELPKKSGFFNDGDFLDVMRRKYNLTHNARLGLNEIINTMPSNTNEGMFGGGECPDWTVQEIKDKFPDYNVKWNDIPNKYKSCDVETVRSYVNAAGKHLVLPNWVYRK